MESVVQEALEYCITHHGLDPALPAAAATTLTHHLNAVRNKLLLRYVLLVGLDPASIPSLWLLFYPSSPFLNVGIWVWYDTCTAIKAFFPASKSFNSGKISCFYYQSYSLKFIFYLPNGESENNNSVTGCAPLDILICRAVIPTDVIIFYTRHWEGELEGLRTTQQRVTAQHLGHQWYNEDPLKQRPVTSPLIPSKFHPFTQLPLPVVSVLIPRKLLSLTIT